MEVKRNELKEYLKSLEPRQITVAVLEKINSSMGDPASTDMDIRRRVVELSMQCFSDLSNKATDNNSLKEALINMIATNIYLNIPAQYHVEKMLKANNKLVDEIRKCLQFESAMFANLRLQACRAVWNMCFNHPRMRHSLSPLIPQLISIITSKNDDAVTMACGALWALAGQAIPHYSHLQPTIDEAKLGYVVKKTREADIQKMTGQIQDIIAGNDGLINALFEILNADKKPVQLKVVVIGLLSALTKDNSENQDTMFNQYNAVEYLAKLLSSETNVDIVCIVLQFLGNLCFKHKRASSEAIRLGVLSWCVDELISNEIEVIRIQACHVITSIILFQPENRAIAIQSKIHVICTELLRSMSEKANTVPDKAPVAGVENLQFAVIVALSATLPIEAKSRESKTLRTTIASILASSIIKCFENKTTIFAALRLMSYLSYENEEAQTIFAMVPVSDYPAAYTSKITANKEMILGDHLILYLMRITQSYTLVGLECLNCLISKNAIFHRSLLAVPEYINFLIKMLDSDDDIIKRHAAVFLIQLTTYERTFYETYLVKHEEKLLMLAQIMKKK